MKKTATAFLLAVLSCCPVFGIVRYDEGRMQINGIQLFQDFSDPLAYYYLPQFPRLSAKEDGTLELLCMKYIGQGGPESNGGLFHALVEFSLPPDAVDNLEKDLKKKIPNARIVGPVPLQEVMQDGENGLASFQVVSSILTNTKGEKAFTRSMICSGHAPLLPGSKAAIAALLNQEGATLLWESLSGPTSDVSVTIRGYYEAAVRGYNATITAESSTIYEHFSRLASHQQGYTKRQLRDITDELMQDQVLKVEVFDRSAALGIKSEDMQGILDLVTDKLVELMFNATTGWAVKPDREVAVEQGQIQGRQERGWFSQVFGGARDEKYVTDDQFVIKDRKDVRINKFYLNLSKSTTIKVPVVASGNLGGLFQALGKDERYFRVVNLDDPTFQKRDVHFQIDGEFAESFKDILNYVTVSFKKSYGEDANDVTKDLVFKKSDLDAGTDFKVVSYPRLSVPNDDWLNYEYRISWSLKGGNTTVQLPRGNAWLKSKEAAISLSPPFSKHLVEIDADRKLFEEGGARSASIRFFVIMGGKAQPQKTVVLRSTDTENSVRTALYHDPGEPIVYQITWYYDDGTKQLDPKELKSDYLFLVPSSE